MRSRPPRTPPDAAGQDARRRQQRRGRVWVWASFVFCPCHLPVTLSVLGLLLGGTALGAVVREHALLAGTVITVTWALGTWRGLRLLRAPAACPLPAARR